MKKLFVIGLAVLMVVAFSGMALAGRKQVFKFKCKVQKYIEVNPDFATITKSIKIPGTGGGVQPPIIGFESYGNDVAYANCPFTISYTGNNAVPDGYPILARQEVDENGVGINRWDRLQTRIRISHTINPEEGYAHGYEAQPMWFLSGSEGVNTGTWEYGPVITFVNTPHNGEINLQLLFSAALPHLSPDFGNPNTWKQSADAGFYECNMLATYAAL